MKKQWNTRVAKLLVAALLLQYLPLLPGVLGGAQAEGTVTQQTYGGGSTVGANTYTTVQPKVINDKLTDYAWKRISLNISPDARQSAAMAYDESAGNVVMFGGQGSTGLLDETWIWDGSQQTWQELLNLPLKPSNRKGAAIAYDPVSRKVLLFGGEGQAGVLNDTWFWNGTDAKWEQVTGLADAPSARGGAQLAYDGEQLVLFGGYTGSGASKTLLGDTWLWNGASWTREQPIQSPPPIYNGRMAYDGYTAILYGGNLGSITQSYVGQTATNNVTHDDSSPLLWKWDRAAKSWSSNNGPEPYGRWGQAMAYDGRRVVFFSGERDYVHMYNAVLVENLKLPSTMYPPMRGSLAYGWTGSAWEYYPLNVSMETVYQSNKDSTGKEYEVQTVPNKLPFPLSDASMAFDGKNFVVFGGSRSHINIMDKVFGSVVGGMPAGNVNETWVFGYTPPTAPGVKMDLEPLINFDPQHTNDTVSVITNVYNDGTRAITSRGVQYRTFTEQGNAAWTDVPYTGSGNQGTGSFTVTLTGLTWQQEYELRGYATNEIGTSYTEVKRFVLKDDPNMAKPDVDYDRVGASVLHVKDKMRLVAVGTGVTNLLRKPLEGIHYFLKSSTGAEYPLAYNIINDRQLELTLPDPKAVLPPGKYSVHLEHVFYQHYVFTDALLVTVLDFYKPRNFAKVEVPSTSTSNEVDSLVVQGPFTEDPSAPSIYVLNDTSEPVTINETILFKGSRLVVDKSGANGKATISGEGRLYVNGGGSEGANLSYTLMEGPFIITSDSFSLPFSNSEATDYLNMNMPVKASSLVFTKDGLRLTGQLSVGMQLGSQRVAESVPVDSLRFSGGRFDLSGSYTMNNSFKVGPFTAKDTKFVVESRIPYVGVQGKGSLPGTDLSFDLYMKTKQGRLDSVSFGMYRKAKLASTGLQVNYLYGNVDKLAEKTQVPQKFDVTGSVMDVIVPELKHPQVNYKFNLVGTDAIDMDVSSYGFNASGIEYYYWLPVNNMSMTAVTDPKAAGIKGFSSPGFAAKGDINVFEVVKGAVTSYSFNQKGYNGVIKGTVYVPKGIPRIGGATVNNVTLSVNESGIVGTFRHNGVGANVKYTFKNNTILFEVEAEPPKKSWWEKGLDFVNNVSDFMEAAEPWLDLAEELLLSKPDSGKQVKVASASASSAALKRAYDLKPISLAFQPEDTAKPGVPARMVEGQLTTLDKTPPMTSEVNAASGQVSTAFAVDRPFQALIAIAGDHSSAVLTGTAPGHTAGKVATPDVAYDQAANVTWMRISLYPGHWKLTTSGGTQISIHELLFANAATPLNQLIELWGQAPDRPVTSLSIKERGSYLLQIGAANGEVIVYKPDGRPYSLQAEQSQPDWNAYRDAGGNLYVLLNAVEAGTWMISAGNSPQAALHLAPAQTTMADVVQWVQAEAYPTAFALDNTSLGQAIVEIYGANAQTKVYTPGGELYPLQLDPNQDGMNALLDESQGKLTLLLEGANLKGEWKATGSRFASVVAYKNSRKFKSIKPLLMEGRYSKYFELAESGNYLLTVSGGNEETVLISPSGEPYTLNFDAPGGNAYLQPASDRMPNASVSGDPLQQTQISTPTPAVDGRDTLYVSLLNAPSGKWTVKNVKKVDLQIQKLLPASAVKASVTQAGGADNRIQLTWSTENAAPDMKVTVMLTDNADQYIGEVIADGLSASGSKVLAIPAETLPGVYRVSVAAVHADKAPVYAVAEGSVQVTAPYTLPAPGRPEVISGNGEVSLRFSAVSGNVTSYRIWGLDAAGNQPLVPLMDVAPVSGNDQAAVVAGLPTGTSYIFSVSAIGQEQGRIVWSPQSETVTTELPAPLPAALAVSLDAGSQPVAQRTYTALDGSAETMLLTATEQASLQVGADQNVSLTLSVHGQQVGSGIVSAGGTYAFKLQDLLNVSVLKEREYNLLIESVNERGDRSTAYRKLVIDRTGPLLIASAGDDNQGQPIALNGKVVDDSKVYIIGQTDIGAKLTVNGVSVPLDDEGRFAYYAPLDWVSNADRNQITMTATDESGNKTEYGFEVLRGLAGAMPSSPEGLSALTTGNAKMSMLYQFGTTSYQAVANSDKVRIYAVPMAANSVVTVDGQQLTANGYVEVEVPASGRNVSIRVQPVGGTEKLYTLQLTGTGSDAAVLRTLKLKDVTAAMPGKELAASPFTGTEDSYPVYVDHAVESVTLTPGALKAGSGIRVKGQSVPSGLASQPIPLQVGENAIPVLVTSLDGTQTRTYNVVVWRNPSSNAQLNQLSLISGGAELLSAFTPNTSSYQVSVPHSAAAITLRATAAQPDASLQVNGQAALSGSAVSIPLVKDAQTLTIEVHAQDGSKVVYTVSVLRQQAVPAEPPLLSSLQVDTVLSRPFSPYKLSYGTTGQTTSNRVNLTAVANDPQAVVTVQGTPLRGGGRFQPAIIPGVNTLIVNVESADRTASQTYSVDVVGLEEDNSSPPMPSNLRQAPISGGVGGWAEQTSIVRTRTEEGRTLDTVKLDAGTAKSIVEKSIQNKDTTARIYVTDLPDAPADERIVSLSAESVSLLAQGGMSMQILLPDAQISLPGASLQQLSKDGKDAYFRVVPIREQTERSDVTTRVQNAELVKQAAGGQPVSVIGQPVKIETNYAGYTTELLLPLNHLVLPADTAAAKRILSQLAVYIEHSDGEKALQQGEIRYDADGKLAGIAIQINKFSTFTIIQKNADALKVLEPYLSGYPDGTFRPSKAITRAELATIVARIQGSSAKGEPLPIQAQGYPDVAPDHWAAEAIAHMQRTGLMLGDNNGLFRPEDAITRGELASIAARLLSKSAGAAQSGGYSDTREHWAFEAIEKASRAGILQGYPDSSFQPDNPLNRAEAVKVLNRLFERPAAAVTASSWPDVAQDHWAIQEIESASAALKQMTDGSVLILPKQ
ncbi:cadherin-like beta sandwich domain-containing protein [Paenibacillus silviterrae]|uniref:cadherin-like beta sandwich domain-containing protein n=1 Tax=Paenibacillus silviterrae TaxID=3242194 RepID=UPI002543F771|nr:cadherin-like beta sandwich domain-containing protein [Paenibacillus chinjuensis]